MSGSPYLGFHAILPSVAESASCGETESEEEDIDEAFFRARVEANEVFESERMKELLKAKRTELSSAGGSMSASSATDSFPCSTPRESESSQLSDVSPRSSLPLSESESKNCLTLVSGTVELMMVYSPVSATLSLTLTRATNLSRPTKEKSKEKVFVYIKAHVTPSSHKGHSQKGKRKAFLTNITFHQTFKFHVKEHELLVKNVRLALWCHTSTHYHGSSTTAHFLGEVLLPCASYRFENAAPDKYILRDKSTHSSLTSEGGRAELSLCLRFTMSPLSGNKEELESSTSNTGELQVTLRGANYLRQPALTPCSPVCKVYLLPDRVKENKRKTSVKRRTHNPIWNETLTWSGLDIGTLHERSLEITMWDYDRFGSNLFLGGVRLNSATGAYRGDPVDWMDSLPAESALWGDVLVCPEVWADGTLQLRSDIDSNQ